MPRPGIIFGTATVGLGFDDAEQVSELLDYLEDNGIDHIDTAGVYPPPRPGMSERLLGQSRASERGFIIDTKILAGPTGGSGDLGLAAISLSLSNSLSRLGAEAVR